MTIAVLGGTGKEGSGLARRWAANGYRVIIGSRDAGRASDAAAEMNEELGGEYVTGQANEDAAAAADIVVLSVPYKAHQPTLESVKDKLAGKVLVDVTVPTPYMQPAVVPEGKSAAQEAQAIVGDAVRVVSAFQNVSAGKLKTDAETIDTDVIVTGDDADAKADVIALAEAAGMRGLDGGPLANAVAAEAMTAVIYQINKKYGAKGAGVRLTGF